MTFQGHHLVLAILLHVLLFGLLAGGAQCSRKIAAPAVIQATLVAPGQRPVERKPLPPVEKPLEKKEPPKPEKKVEEPPKPREDPKKLEQQRLEEQKRKQSEFAEKKKLEEAALRKKEEEERRRRELAEQERKRREAQEQELIEQAMREEAMQRELARETQGREDAVTAERVNAWAAQLQNHLAKNWTRPPATSGALQCTMRVQLLPDGTVTGAKMSRSTGNAALDRSCEDAVFRSSPFPLPADPGAFQRDLTINFVPAE